LLLKFDIIIQQGVKTPCFILNIRIEFKAIKFFLEEKKIECHDGTQK